MEPQIIDYYNEMPSGVNVIEKMNEELEQVQKENNILKDDLCMNPEYGRPIVEYKCEEELENKKNELYKILKNEIYKSNGNIEEKTIKKVLYKLIPNHYEAKIKFYLGSVNGHECLTRTNWVHRTSCNILKYVNYSKISLEKLNIEPDKICDNIYDIITNEINGLMSIGGNIVKYRCRKCNELVEYIMEPPMGDGNTCCSCWTLDLGF